MTSEKAKPWLDEPDRAEFEAHGLKCVMIRHPRSLHWCGYVRVGEDHPWYGKDYSHTIYDPPAELIERPIDVDKVGVINVLCAGMGGNDPTKSCELSLLLDAHGGITFTNDHPGGDETKDGWWFGFDCAHAGDLIPGHLRFGSARPHETYRDEAYVRAECESLAKQLVRVSALRRAEGNGEEVTHED